MSIRTVRGALALFASTALVLSFAAAQAADSFSTLKLGSGGLSGAAAVSALGSNLNAVAAQYGKTGAQLRKLLLRDKTLKVATNGRLYYAEDAAQVPGGPGPDDVILNGTILPLNQTFRLHSRPESNRLLILDFQGKTISGTYWNTALGRASFVASPFDLDGNAATFSDAERTAIQTIWQRVAEDYAPFDVDVTTDVNAIAAAPAGSQYATAVITRQRDYFGSAPGIAYTSTFGNAMYDPAFVAYDTLSKNPKYIAEAVAHEFGHRLGLDHDGTRNAPYYAGQGTAPMRWAPIMGNSYLANVSQFSKGEYRNANNTQDDYAIISRFLAFRQDNAGDTMAQAATLPASNTDGRSSGSVSGAIDHQDDVDLFAISAGAGPISASVTPASLGPDADLTVSLLNNAGETMMSSTLNSALNGAISGTLAHAGTYYLQVAGSGYGDPASNGFSTYGSRGLYRLTASYPAAAETAPVAVISAGSTMGAAPFTVAFTGSASGGSGAITSYSWKLGNGATGTSRAQSATYTQPGVYTAEFKVTDSAGFSGATSKQVVVGKLFTAATLTIARSTLPDGSYGAAVNANAFSDASGRRLVPTALYGRWSGAVQGDAKGSGFTRSGSNFASPATRDAGACFTFTLTRIDAVDPSTPGQAPVSWFTQAPRMVTSCPQQASR